MFTILRKINGNRTPTEHESPTLGDTKSRVFKDAMALLKESNDVHNALDEQSWVNSKPEPIDEWVARFKKAYETADPSAKELTALAKELCPDITKYDRVLWCFNFNDFLKNVQLETATELFFLVPPGTDELRFGVIPDGGPETRHQTLDFIQADDIRIAVYNRNGLWAGMNSDVLESSEPTEVSSVELLHYFDPVEETVKEQVLKFDRPGSRRLEDIIGVLSYGVGEDGPVGEQPAPYRAVYEFIYKGDEVYITNRHGKTVDSIR